MRVSYVLWKRTAAEAFERYKAESTIYFHWPFCKNICTYCSFNKYVQSERKFGSHFEKKLHLSLLKETETLLKFTGVKKVKSVYFGGGTPSLAPSEVISSLIKCVKEHSDVCGNAEVSVECNPSSSNMYSLLEKYVESGVNRVSIGLQSVNDSTLKMLGRDHSAKEGLALVKQAQAIFGADSVSIDLLFAKPDDTEESWLEELNQILDFRPSHLSLYELTLERGTKLQKQVQLGELRLPDENARASMYQKTIEHLKRHGLERYEISSFSSKLECRSTHNSSYWNGSQYIGIGPGAHSRFYVPEHPFREARVQYLDPRIWREAVERDGCGTNIRRKQNQLDVLSELLATSLRTVHGTRQERWNIFETKHSLSEVFQSAHPVQQLCHDGYLEWYGTGNLRATDRGLNVIDSVLPTLIRILIDRCDMNTPDI